MKRIPIMSLVLYILASLLGIYAIWSFYHSHRYISDMIAMNQLMFRGNEYDIINFYVGNTAQYLLFTVILIALGWLLQRENPIIGENILAIRKTVPDKKSKNEIEEEFEEWFKNNKD